MGNGKKYPILSESWVPIQNSYTPGVIAEGSKNAQKKRNEGEQGSF